MRAVSGAVLLVALTACGGSAPPASSPAPPAVDSPLCDDLRTAVRPASSPEDAGQAAARVLEQAVGGSDDVLPAEVEAALRERAAGRAPASAETSSVKRFVQERCG